MDWWRGQRSLLPKLYQISLEILIIPATSTSAERSFSKAQKIDTPARSSLLPETLENLLMISTNIDTAEEIFASIPEAGSH
jgi:hypothetical protein